MTSQSLKQRFGAFRYYLVIIALLVLSGWLGYQWAGIEQQRLQDEISRLNHSMNNLVTENNRLTRDLNILGVDLEVARLASEESRKQILQQMTNEKELRRELSFYQKVMAPELEQDGFIIDSFNVEPSASEGFFRYALIVMQQDKHRTTVKGQVDITLIGSQDGKPTELKLQTVLSETSDNLSFSFRYFEVLKGEFSLPSGFAPEIISVEAKLKDKKWGSNFLKRSFDWQLEETE